MSCGVVLEIYNFALAKQVDVKLLFRLSVTFLKNSLLMHYCSLMQTMLLTLSIEKLSSTTSDIYVCQWQFTSGIVIVYHLTFLSWVALKSCHRKEQPKVILLPVYTIGITPLLEAIKPGTIDASRVRHVAFADDLRGAGELMHLRNW